MKTGRSAGVVRRSVQETTGMPVSKGVLREKFGAPIMVPVNAIVRDPRQPRETFTDQELRALGQSMLHDGQVEVVYIRSLKGLEKKDGKRFRLLNGERRWRAAQKVGLKDLLCILVNISDERVFDFQVIANYQRQPFSEIEEARICDRFKEAGLSWEDIGRKFGKGAAWARSRQALVRLEPEVQELMSHALPEEQRLLPATGLALIGLPSDDQKRLASMAIQHRWTIGQARHQVRLLTQKGVRKAGMRGKPSDDYRIFLSFLLRSSRSLNQFGDFSDEAFQKMFAKRSQNERERLAGIIDQQILDLNTLQERIRGAFAPPVART